MREAARSFDIIGGALPTVFFLADCGFVDRAFEALVRNDCDDVQANTQLLFAGGLASGLMLTLASFFFCVCFRCAPRLCLPLFDCLFVSNVRWAAFVHCQVKH